MSSRPRSDDVDVARSVLASDLRSCAGFDPETASSVVEALFSGSMSPEEVVGGILGGDAAGAAAVSRFVAAVEGANEKSRRDEERASATTTNTTYQPPSLSAEASAARAADEARRSAAAAVAAVSTGALAPPSAPGERTGRALAFKEAKKKASSAAADLAEAGAEGKRVLAGGAATARPAERRHANCLRCGKVYDTASADPDTRRLLQTGRCTFGGCGGESRVALRGGEVSDVRPRASPPPAGASTSSSSSSSAWTDDVARNPWLSSSERKAAIATAVDLERAGDPRKRATTGEEREATPTPTPLGPAPGVEQLPFSDPSSPLWRRGGASGGREGTEEQRQVVPGWHGGDGGDGRGGGKRKGKKKSGV